MGVHYIYNINIKSFNFVHDRVNKSNEWVGGNLKKDTYWWVWLIIIINIGVYFIESSNNAIRDSYYLFSIGAFRKGSLNNISDMYRIFTCQFIHSGFLHLFLNMSCLFLLTKNLKRNISSLSTFVIYCIALIVVGVSLTLFGRGSVVYVGNSGAICALSSAGLIYGINTKKKIKLLKNEIETILIIIISSIILPEISLTMHLSGLLAGAITAEVIIFLKSKKVKCKLSTKVRDF